MQEQKHTPGPWRSRTGYTNGEPVTLEVEAGVHGIATLPYNLPNGTEADLEREEANAALIAAAPDMYEALRDVLEALSGTDYTHAADVALHDAAAALAKAEGRA